VSALDVEDVPEPQHCGWPHPTIGQWTCSLPLGHTGDCMRLGVYAVLGSWPGPGSTREARS
jgi:hypothetical protein